MHQPGGHALSAIPPGTNPLVSVSLQDDVPADDFWREISILRTCRHGNIVQFQVRGGARVG